MFKLLYATWLALRWLMPHILKFQRQLAKQSYKDIDWSYVKADSRWLWSRVFGFLIAVGIAGIGSFLFKLRLLVMPQVSFLYGVDAVIGCIGLVAGMLLTMLPLPSRVYKFMRLIPQSPL